MKKTFDKNTALTVCNALIKICIDRGGMKEGSIMHLMGRRLMNYIGRDMPRKQPP
jgi:hypothetical protein